MSKTIVTGGLGFLGFELCLAILEEGNEVLAVDLQEEAGERWLEVGRNANISYQPLNKTLTDEMSEASIYINLYDCLTQEGDSNHFYHGVEELIKKNRSKVKESVLLIPTVLSKERSGEELKAFLGFLDEQPFQNCAKIYVPTLIGPYQPETFLFQQLITNSDSDMETCSYVDDIRSAIFVKDAAKTIVNMNTELNECMLVSNKPDSWKESLNILGEIHAEQREKHTAQNICPDGLKQIVVKSSSPLKQILEWQKGI